MRTAAAATVVAIAMVVGLSLGQLTDHRFGAVTNEASVTERAVSVAACDTVGDMPLYTTRRRLSTIGRT